LDTEYFRYLSNIYLSGNTLHRLRQLTVGLEAGQEGFQFSEEMVRQLNVLKNSKFLTMEEYSDLYHKSSNSENISSVMGSDYFADGKKAFWFNFPDYRAYFSLENGNLYLKDLKIYNDLSVFKDLFFKDREKNLVRILPSCIDDARMRNKFLIADSVGSATLTKDGSGFLLALKRNNGDGKKLFLNAEGIKYGEKGILSIGRGLNIKGVINENFIKLLVDFQTKRSSALISLPVFSKINGDYYFGLPLYPDMLIGLKSSFPYIGIFRFQFQYLSKFKTQTQSLVSYLTRLGLFW